MQNLFANFFIFLFGLKKSYQRTKLTVSIESETNLLKFFDHNKNYHCSAKAKEPTLNQPNNHRPQKVKIIGAITTDVI